MALFVTFEGIDGSGKSLQIRYLTEYFKKINKKVIITREPGGTKIGEKIRNIVLDNNNTEMDFHTEALLYASSRAQLIAEVIKPALNNNDIVISDRFVDSSLMYQGILRGLGVDKVQTINDFALQNVTPDITFLLDISPEISEKRKYSREVVDRLDSEDFEFYKRLRQEYLTLASKNRNRIIVINSISSPETVHNTIINILKRRNFL